MGMTDTAGAALREAEAEIAAVLDRLQSKLGAGCSVMVDVGYVDVVTCDFRRVYPAVALSVTLRGGSI